ncbi:E3 ubiquitin-protein ligase TRIM11 [Callorhinchus milii]|uniref:E3 ubiquitin-protein ligase TRIM11 n=1 Tax=Callorhinchus milii TaxID=7868 RepID=UPI001C3F9328|nr:E3 ubiquitin-protein ligase TRIM11 [Callorhinchus milii]
MASGLAQESLEEELTCAVCLGIYTDPVVLECKHSFCRACIEEFWSGAAPGTYSCPECRAETSERPGLEKNFKLASIVQKYLALQSSRGAGVLCSYCTQIGLLAVKSCLKCEASMCPRHLRHHTQSAVFRSHLLIDPTADVSLWKCSEHQELLRIYCKDDRVCICSLCALIGKHKNHNCGSISEGEKELRDCLQHQLQSIRNNGEAVQSALKHLHREKQNMQRMKRETQMKIRGKYEALRKCIESEERRVLQYLESEKRRVTDDIETTISELENRKKDLEKALADLSDLLQQNKEVVFIQGLNSMEERIKDVSEPFVPLAPVSDVNKSVLEKLAAWVQAILTPSQREGGREEVTISFPSAPQKWQQTDGQTPTLDPDTAFPNLVLSDSNRTVSGSKREHPYPHSPKRFNYWWQVLSTEGVSCGRSYWEVEAGGDRRRWDIGVCYGSLSRKGEGAECSLGQNKKSWCLYSEPGKLVALHNNNTTKLAAESPCTVGVFVDFEAGIISFYCVSGTDLTLLHTFQQQTFTEPLYPALGVADFATSLSLQVLK